MKLNKFALCASLAAAFATSVASAAIPLASGIAVLEDDNIEYVIRDGVILPRTSNTVLQEGDILRAVITFTKSLDGSSNLVSNLGAPGLELTGISEIEVIDITGGVIQFGPSASFGATYGAGAIAALFSQTPGDLLMSCNSATISNCETPATNGNPWMTVGFADGDDYWVAEGVGIVDLSAATIANVAGTAATTKLGVANYALSILSNNTGYAFNQQTDFVQALNSSVYGSAPDDGFVDIIGSGDILGGAGLAGPWFARSDFDFQLNRVPEPTTLALLGLGLAGIGLTARRRRA